LTVFVNLNVLVKSSARITCASPVDNVVVRKEATTTIYRIYDMMMTTTGQHAARNFISQLTKTQLETTLTYGVGFTDNKKHS